MTDALSEHAREQREEREQTQPPPAKKPRRAPVRPVYQFPDDPTEDEEAAHESFVGSCRDRAESVVHSDILVATLIYDDVSSQYSFPSLQSDVERARVILDIASRLTAERLREQRRRCAVSVGASMQD